MNTLTKTPRISIVIPSYNQGHYLEQAIQSVLGQGYPELELIIIDGGSTDNSLEIIKKYSSHLAYWESTPDRGQAHAINKGFAHATGEIITFLSSDDYYLPDTFFDVAEQYSQNPEAGAIIGGFCFLDEDQSIPNEPIQPFVDGPTPVDLTLGPPGKYRMHQAATFYTCVALDAVGRTVQEDMKYVMDRELLYRVCRLYPLVLSQAAYGVFRRHLESKSVKDILPFAREFSSLYLSALSVDTQANQLRRNMAKYRLSRGYVKYANANVRSLASFIALARAGLVYPSLFVSASYWKSYLKLAFLANH